MLLMLGYNKMHMYVCDIHIVEMLFSWSVIACTYNRCVIQYCLSVHDFIIDTGRCCDEGKSFLIEVPDSPATTAYRTIINSK